MKNLSVTPCHSLLPNSSPEVLAPRTNAQGTFQVAWIARIAAHGLFFTDTHKSGTSLLATHHNGYSCASLADRICSGDPEKAEKQRDYIAKCGGTVCHADFLSFYVTGN